MSQLKTYPHHLFVCLACLLLALGGPALTRAEGQDVSFPQSSLIVESAEDRFEFQVELALTPQQRARGLMFREELSETSGMLFDFGRLGPVTMWMRNTLIPLDMLFVDSQGQITRIVANAEPLSETTISSGGPARAVLELRGGVTEKLGIQPGDRIVHPLFSAPASSG